MKKITLLVVLLCIAALLVCGCAPQNATPTDATGDAAGDPNGTEGPKDYTGTFRVGFGRVNITPDLGIGLAGMGDDAKRLATDIDTPLYMTCIAVTDENENTALLMTSDSIRTETWVCDLMRGNISRELNIPKTAIISSTTHTHNAPDTIAAGYTQLYVDAGLEACKLAMEDRKPADIYSGNTYTDNLNFIRHYLLSDGTYTGDGYGDPTGKTYVRPAAEVDNEVQLIKFVREDGKDIVLMNWRAHPIMDDHDYTKISAGYVGHCRREIEKQLDCHFAYIQGASGNVRDLSNIRELQNFRSHKEQGQKLAQAAIDAMPSLKKVESGAVEIRTVTYQGNIRQDSEEYAKAAQTFKDVKNRGGSTAEAIAATGGLVNSNNALQGVNMRKEAYAAGNGKMALEMTAVSIGDVAFVSSPWEMFSETGEQIKEGSPYEQTFVMYLANGRGKYLPTDEYYVRGCYEKEIGYFVRGTAEEVGNVYIDMLKDLYKDGVADPTVTTFDSQLPNE